MAANEPITVRQIQYISDLINNPNGARDLSTLKESTRRLLAHPDGPRNNLNRGEASSLIKRLLQLPIKPPEQAPETDWWQPDFTQQPTDVPANPVGSAGQPTSAGNVEVPDKGYYFIVDPTDGSEKFYRVTKGAPGGRWEGFTFLHVQASQDFYPIKDKARRDQVYAAIAVDPVNAMNEYGIRLGVCGCCGRTLTDRDSRLRGIGPICAARLDFAAAQVTPAQEQLLMQLGLIPTTPTTSTDDTQDGEE